MRCQMAQWGRGRSPARPDSSPLVTLLAGCSTKDQAFCSTTRPQRTQRLLGAFFSSVWPVCRCGERYRVKPRRKTLSATPHRKEFGGRSSLCPLPLGWQKRVSSRPTPPPPPSPHAGKGRRPAFSARSITSPLPAHREREQATARDHGPWACGMSQATPLFRQALRLVRSCVGWCAARRASGRAHARGQPAANGPRRVLAD
jgi:hypothetical protein